ncbi:MAG: hypothetical protein K2K80_06380 [Clostridia bacterium]|nr:hypothetical protein [Clostridia bacterium]
MKIKKLSPVIAALCITAAVFSGCNTNHNTQYDELNAMLDVNYSKVVLTVTDTFGADAVLVSEYTIKFSDDGMTVNYSVERFSEVSLDFVPSLKTTLVGEALVADGKVTYVQGDEVNMDALTTGTGFDFKEEYFDNIDLTGVYLMADVNNPSGFIGSSLTCTEMKVKATFLKIFYDIKITYRSQSGNQVECLYVFSL